MKKLSANCGTSTALLFGILCSATFASATSASTIDIPAPPGATNFGAGVVVLPNGNILVSSGDIQGIHAYYLYSGTGTLISTLTGSRLGAVSVLKNGNFLIVSPSWSNGNAYQAGAVTWGSAETGVSGEVSSANSLVGTTAGDQVGERLTVLENGNYVVRSRYWNNGSIASAGAVTLGNGSTGTSGEVSANNSLVGTHYSDNVGEEVTALSNGNYVIGSPRWDSDSATDVGAVTWVNGNVGGVGAISSGNSLLGYGKGWNGYGGISALTNGNYVVTNPSWRNANGEYVGAVMWCNGTGPTLGVIAADRALVGTTPDDHIGDWPVTALSNGNYVVVSANWDSGAIVDAGAVTWGNGATGTTGVVSPANSLVGSTSNDLLGRELGLGAEVVALKNGNFVLKSAMWDNGAVANVGAVTWGNGSTGTSGVISPANSLVGTAADDHVGAIVVPLANGHYVVGSPDWDNAGTPNVGAATWANGNAPATGAITIGNSLVGSSANDRAGSPIALSNGNYVVLSPWWSNGDRRGRGGHVGRRQHGYTRCGVGGEFTGGQQGLR